MNKLFCDLKTDEEKAAFFLSGRGYETGVIAHSIQNDVAMAYHRCAEYKEELAALQAENDRLTRYYKNGIDCFANPCERHSGERTPPFAEFFENYGGQCLICVVDENEKLQAECEKLRKLHQDAYQRGFHEGSRGLRDAYNAIQEVKRQDAWGNAQLTEAQLAAEGRAERVEIENAALKAENERLRKRLAAIEGQEPVAWKWRCHPVDKWVCVGHWDSIEAKAAKQMEADGWEVVRLYRAPTAAAVPEG